MTMESFALGRQVMGADGVCGKLERLALDPLTNEVMHLMVEPAHGAGFARLLPLSMVESAGDPIVVSCTFADFMQLPHAENTAFLPRRTQVLGQPVYLGMRGLRTNQAYVDAGYEPYLAETLPPGEVSVRPGQPVHASDGDVGHVQGLVLDRESGHVAYVLLQEGHRWGKRDITIPIAAVMSVERGVSVSLSTAEIEALPPVELEHPTFGD